MNCRKKKIEFCTNHKCTQTCDKYSPVKRRSERDFATCVYFPDNNKALMELML